MGKTLCKILGHDNKLLGVSNYLAKFKCYRCECITYMKGYAPFDYDYTNDFNKLKDIAWRN